MYWMILLLGLVLMGSDPASQAVTHTQVSTVNPMDTVPWSPPIFEERKEERLQLVRESIVGRVGDDAVLNAMKNVPRHLFVPEDKRDKAYRDIPLPIGHGQTISQPFIVAYMTQMLDLSKGDKVLEIGTGSGYQAAVLSEITPEVYTIEIIDPLAVRASKRFEELGYTSIKAKDGDGYYGWKEYAPFDAIIVTAAAGHIPPPLTKQLKAGGKMAIPIGSPYETQTLVKVTKSQSGEMDTERKLPVRFVPMTGKVQQGK